MSTISPAFSEKSTLSLLENAVLKSVKHRYESQLPSDKIGNKAPINPMVIHSRPEHGDYQCMIAMSLAKQLKLKHRDVAEGVMQDLLKDEILLSTSMLDRMDVSGPGFINMHLSNSFLEKKVQSMLSHTGTDTDGSTGRLGVPVVEHPEKIVVDFSSPNIAKEMHVVRTLLFVLFMLVSV